jgi:hypothetical protein
MKKTLIQRMPLAVLVIFYCLLTTSYTPMTDVIDVNANTTKQYVEIAKNLITDFYKNKDLGMENDLSQYIGNEGLLSYLTDKYKTHQQMCERISMKKINYTLKLELLEEKTKNSKCYLKFAVIAKYNYANLPNEDSGFGEVVEVLLKELNGKYLAIDYYTRYNYYDSAVRGEDCDVVKALDDNRDLEKNNELQSDKIKEKQLQLRNGIDKSHDGLFKQPTQQQTNYSTFATLNTLSPLSKPDIVAYARTNYNLSSPNSGNNVVNYYDFSQLPGNYDCTNFVSHALLAGGATVYNTGRQGISPTGWYYTNLGNRSSSWSGVQNLYNFLTTNTTRGPAATSFDYYIFDQRYGQPYSQGDILQFYQNSISTWRHSAIVTGFYLSSERYLYGAMVTGRSEVGSYNNNDPAELINPGAPKRIVKLLGNYN